jgi:hypothetical protein
MALRASLLNSAAPAPHKAAAVTSVNLLSPKETAKLLKVRLYWLAKARMSGEGPPHRDKSELYRLLSDLHAGNVFDHAAVHELFCNLEAVIRRWQSEQERLEGSPIPEILVSTAESLDRLHALLGASRYVIADYIASSEIQQQLELNPAIGSEEKAREFMSSFRRDAALLSDACMAIAGAAVSPNSGRRGRPRLGWYDDFTALLLEIAHKANVDPTLRKDRGDSAPSGWLLDAAQALETFLEPLMRSPTIVACAKRLERSRERLGRSKRQKPSAR